MEKNNKAENYLIMHRIEAMRKSMNKSKQKGIDIYRSALNRLDGDGFHIEDRGSQDIARLINQLYHERLLLEKYYKRPSYIGYWDLSDISNPHYSMINDMSNRKIMDNIREAIIHSYLEEDDADINDLIYELTDNEISLYNEDDRPYSERISYKKLLLK